MENELFDLLQGWVGEALGHLLSQGWAVALSDFQDHLVLDLETPQFYGRLDLWDTGRAELGTRSKETGEIRRGECEIYTAGQLEDLVVQFLDWILGTAEEQAKVECPHGKTGFPDRAEAERSLARFQSKKRVGNTVTVYLCKLCRQWHIGGILGRVGLLRRPIPQRTRGQGNRRSSRKK